MRKHLVIGIMAVLVVTSVTVYVASQPKEGSLEWHKQEFRSLSRGTAKDQALNVVQIAQGKADHFCYLCYGRSLTSEQQRRQHQVALIDLGFLAECEFIVSNRPVDEVMFEAGRLSVKDPRWTRVEEDFVEVRKSGTNVVVVVCAAEDLMVISNALRQVDAPTQMTND